MEAVTSGKLTKVTVNVAAVTEGEAVPAIEGTDFNIKNKTIVFEEGFGTQYIEIEAIDNDLFTGKKTFNLVIASTVTEIKIQDIYVIIRSSNHCRYTYISSIKSGSTCYAVCTNDSSPRMLIINNTYSDRILHSFF